MLFRNAFLTVFTASLMCTAAIARETQDRPTMSLGYQRANIKNFGDVYGGNFRFQFESGSPWGVMGSLTAMKKNWDDESTVCRRTDTRCRKNYREKHKLDKTAEYYSLQAGPTYRFSDKLSLFALAGMSHTSVDKHDSVRLHGISSKTRHQHSSNQYAFSYGLTFNATDNLALTTGYEGSRATFNDRKHLVKSVFIDAGYRF